MAGTGTNAVYTRRRGVLMPIFSLPSEYGIGTLGREAYAFVDTLAECGASIWAMLPTGVTGYGDSPYQSFSSFALNPYFLDLGLLCEEGLLTRDECASVDFGFDASAVDYGKLFENRFPLLMTAYARAIEKGGALESIVEFEKTAPWLEDFAVFTALKQMQGGRPWYEWDEELKMRDPAALLAVREKIACEVGFHKFLQMKLSEQWDALARHALEKGVFIMGDLPIYCAYDSADCWAYRENFRFTKDGRPVEVAGVPPDYFCEDGQLWGNPVYDWPRMKKDGFSFWMARLRRAAELYSMLRIDHFRGFASYYAVPAGAVNAKIGEWRKAEGRALFKKAAEEELPVEIIAEDLGFITRDVKLLLTNTGFAGMQVMEFAFDRDRKNPHKNKRWDGRPESLRNKIAYTGTHDNTTLLDWWEQADEETKKLAEKYAGTKNDMPFSLMKAILACDARLAVIPAADVLLKGAEARINTPATETGNWTWRMEPSEKAAFAENLKKLFE